MASGTQAELQLVELTRDGANKVVVNLHGATIQSWVHDGTEMLFVSKKAVFDNKKGIRGGIPIVFPHFGPWDKGPQHGFARTSKWLLKEGPTKESNEDIKAVFSLTDSDDTRKLWDNQFELDYIVCLKVDALFTELVVKNLNDSSGFDFTCLLHTYFSVPDVLKATVSGLSGLKYLDKTDGMKAKQETAEPKFIKDHTDGVYIGATENHYITNAAGDKTIHVVKRNFPDTVLWNPWEAGAAQMSDFGENEHLKMLCVEVGHVAQPLSLSAKETFSASQTLQIVQCNK